MIKRQTLIMLAVLCMVTLPATALENATIGIGDGSGYVTIPIVITNSTNVGSMTMDLTYDPSIVIVANVVKGDMDATVLNLENVDDGWIRIVAYQGSNVAPGSTFTLAHVSFEPVGDAGSCPLEISVAEFAELTPVGNAMSYIVENGVYTIAYDEERRGGGGSINYPLESADVSGGKNVTEEVPPGNATIDKTPVAPPVRELPGNGSSDSDTVPSMIWIYVVIGIVIILVVAYVISKRNE